MAIRSEEDLGEALKGEQDSIEIKGCIKNAVLRINQMGGIARALALSANGVARVAFIVPEGASDHPPSLLGVSALGIESAVFAIAIAASSDGVGDMNPLRTF
jgi:hypothetical protein